ncbi:hypothetical protein BUY43_07595 [Staphylococcus devriesei]|uniref:Uncharacterized protein n=1 Tax=Staphylococcus devriesei TaxID=586733 RepID=A0A2T4KH66_9STAP|nr:hypothetical protein BUY44_06775 [Staphylococcus devriesei]PTG36087.1 hypothetical protein BU624_10130 [Staphylococcus capitis]PTK20904.1 hypothetical protein BUZ52_09540 [Staphylococcus hominis]PTK54273.1 hypothetical protein BUZ33_11170 [Staphylococcus haemolyticus]PTK65448.1 hypothetical protein BUZ28_11530 [Staphylococcus borealis]HDJ7625366.1 hypothetical protein [Staphylococcus aureus]
MRPHKCDPILIFRFGRFYNLFLNNSA